jgi:hypothetical protein
MQNEDANQGKGVGEIMAEGTAYTGAEMINGIFLCGTIIGRNRAYVGDNKRELITYKVMASNNVYFLKEWRKEQSSEYFCIGEIIKVPVLVGVDEYKGRHTLNITLKYEDTGEF